MSPRITNVWRRTFASARGSRNFRLFLSGQFVSAIGTWMTFTATSWLVLTLTGSGTALGINAALAFGPVLVLGPWGGVLADRFDKRRILTFTQSTAAVISLSLATIVFTDVVSLWMVFALSLASGIVISIDNPARQSFYVEMVGEGTLTNAVSLNSAAFTGARIIGPAVAGILIATVGMAICFLIDGISYLAVLAALLAMHGAEMHAQRRSTRERGHLVAGLRYVWETDALRRPLLVMAVVFTFVFEWQVLVPLLAEPHVPRGAGCVRPALGGRGARLVHRGDPGGEPQRATVDARPRCLARRGRRDDGAGLGRSDASRRHGPHGADRVLRDVVHDHGQHDAPAGGQTRRRAGA